MTVATVYRDTFTYFACCNVTPMITTGCGEIIKFKKENGQPVTHKNLLTFFFFSREDELLFSYYL